MKEISNNTFDQHRPIRACRRITLQEETDGWGLLYDPRIDFSMSINPEGVYIWKQLNKQTSVHDIVAGIEKRFGNVSQGVENDVTQFVKGFVNIDFITSA